jgi:hypothetical protein
LILGAAERCGYVILKKAERERLQLDSAADKSAIAALAGQREACRNAATAAIASANAAKDDACRRMAEWEDELRRLRLRFEPPPEINYQALMEHIGKETAFNNLEPAFHSLYTAVKSCTMTSIEALYALYKSIEYVTRANIPGDIVECGVWRGGSMMLAALTLMALGAPDRRLVLFDTFGGHPAPHPEKDGQGLYDEWLRRRRPDQLSDWADASLTEVFGNLEGTGYPMDKVVLVKGRVEDTVPASAMPETIALLRLDTDWHESTVCELTHLYPRLATGGVLIIDDYGVMPGVRRAVDEYIAAHPAAPLLNRVDFAVRVGVKV